MLDSKCAILRLMCIINIYMLYVILFSVFACLGFLSPANRGALMTCVLVSSGLAWSLYKCMTFRAERIERSRHDLGQDLSSLLKTFFLDRQSFL